MTTTSLSSALLISASGLQAAQAGIDVVSRNVSNAQIPGYTSKTAPQETIVAGDVNSGVRTLAITRFVNSGLLRQLQTANSANQKLSTVSAFLQSFQSNFGAPGNTTNLSAQIGNLQNAFSALTVSPDDPTTQTQAISTAQNLVQQFNLLNQNISQIRQQADAAINTSVSNINTSLQQIYDLNNQIVSLKAQDLSTADLEDQRDNAVNSIAQEIGVSTSLQSNGALYVQTTNGISLLDATFTANSTPVTFSPTPVVLAGAAYYPPPSTSLSTAPLSGVKISGVDVTSQITSGNIAGDLTIRDNVMPATQSQLDELSANLINSFNNKDLQLFQSGTLTLPSADTVQTALASGATSVTVQSTTNLSAGMTMQFASQPGTTYQIVSIAGTTINFVQAGKTTGTTAAIPQSDNITFGLAVPELTNGAASAAAGSTTVTLAGAVGAQVGMRIKFANQSTIYTITNVNPASPSGAAQQITLQPDGGSATTGLLASVAAGETISVLPPVSGLVGLAGNITVNPNVLNNPWRMRDGTRVQAPSTLTGNNTLPTNIVNMMNAQQSFSTNTGLPTTATLQNFATAAIAFQANQAATTKSNLDSAATIYNSLNKQFQDQSGVNVDQQLATMIQVQSSYAASARTITAIKQMMDQLLQAVQ